MLLLFQGANAPSPAHAAAPEPLRATNAAVASDHAAASAAGVQVLKAGGNAVDAACATALALGVVNPQSSGLGGGGFALVYLAKEKKVYALDFRETAPAALTTGHFFKDGKHDPKLSREGGLAVGIPGEPRGLGQLVKRFGKLPFAACVRPAERLARGVPASLRVAEVVNSALDRPGGRALMGQVFAFPPKGPPEKLRAGNLLRRPALATTLATLRRQGPDAFYRGPIARGIVDAVRAAGGVITMEDLASYKTAERTPLLIEYRGNKVFTMPPPSSGGIVIAEVLGILGARTADPARLGHGSSAYLHLLAEALKHGFADRARHLGDPAFVDVPIAKLTDPAYHQELASRIKDNAVLPPERYGMLGAAPGPKDGGTAHLSVIDAEGNAVALTTTVNLWFGARIVAGKTGVVLNDQMDDFSIVADVPNAFGLVGKDKNFVAAGKRPLSSMSPTIVLERDQVKLAVGGAGGPRIISATLQVLLNVIDFKMDAQAASAAPRIHHQWSPAELGLEPEIPNDVIDGLERRGHKTKVRGHIATVNVVVRGAETLEAAAEFRGGGGPAGY